MSNTYFKIETVSKEWDSLDAQLNKEQPHNSKSDVSLTAFMGGDRVVQLTVCKRSGRDTGIAYATLTTDECIQLAGALLERVGRVVSSTGEEKSVFANTYNEYPE